MTAEAPLSYQPVDDEGHPTQSNCPHLETLGPVPAPQQACVDCLREGTRWVHLRQCLVCGGVHCCDNSPRRHATAHYHSTGHPLMRSAEFGEDWAWCYVDELLLLPTAG